MIKYFTISLHSIVFGIQLFWAGVEAIREISDKKVLYYVFTFLPIVIVLVLGILPIFFMLGLFLITPTVAILWTGVVY